MHPLNKTNTCTYHTVSYKQREITQHFRLEPLMSLKQTYIDISHKQ